MANIGPCPAPAPRRGTSCGAPPPSSPSRAGCASSSRTPFPRPPARPRSSTAASTSSASRHATPTRPDSDVGWPCRGDLVPVPRRAHGAQERSPARARIRTSGRGDADVRRRRPAPSGARRPRRNPSRGPRRPRRRPDLDRSLRRPLPAEPRGAVRARDAGGDGVGALGRRHDRRRPAGVRDARGRGSRRSARRASALASALVAGSRAARAPTSPARDAAGDHDVRLQAERVEAILVRAARGRRA